MADRGRPCLITAVAALIVVYPCALGLARPTALMVGTGRSAPLGSLIEGPEVLETTLEVVSIELDQTGTVTTDEHPIAQAIAPGAAACVGSSPLREASRTSPDSASLPRTPSARGRAARVSAGGTADETSRIT
ncbi:hypothetical protein ADL00_34385 [Streptomyces sp. AS58]|nr:hypothetical protein ADL00_34385 [Streptomyces sp. AS58]